MAGLYGWVAEAVKAIPGNPVPALEGSGKFRRGFVHSLTCTAADWLTHADAILAAQPVEEVTLTTLMPIITPLFLAAIGLATAQQQLSSRWPRIKTWHLPDPDEQRILYGDPQAPRPMGVLDATRIRP